MERLLERAGALAELHSALGDAVGGLGRVVLVSGEAGAGKTTLLRTFRDQVRDGVRVLHGACDDLLTARPLGPLHELAEGTSGPLAAALASGGGDQVFAAVLAELSGTTPTVLLLEDLHWADDATLDVLGYLARRVSETPALLVVTARHGASEGHPVSRWLGLLARDRRVRRVALAPLSVAAVGELAADSHWDPSALHALTGGNPFFVTEVLAAATDDVPATVADAVLPRIRRLSDESRTALARLAVIPGAVDFALAEILLGGSLVALAEPESQGILHAGEDGVRFRHELARRAVEESLPVVRRRELHQAVTAVLRAQAEPDLARLVHHATCAGDADTVLAYAARAGEQAAKAGSHREALAHYTAAVRYADRLDPAERAVVLGEYGWELHNAHRFGDAVLAGARAVELQAESGDPLAHGRALVRLSRLHYLAGSTAVAEAVASSAVDILMPTGSTDAAGYATVYHGAVLALVGDPRAAATLIRAKHLADVAGRTDLVELCLNYLSLAVSTVDVEGRITLVRQSLDLALRHGHHEHVARGYTNLGELLHRHHRLDDLDRCLADGLTFTRDRGFWSHAYNLDVHAALLDVRRGNWAGADSALTALADREAHPGMLSLYRDAVHGRLVTRQGDTQAGDLLTDAWHSALDQRSLTALALTGTALVEWAWLTGRPELIADILDEWRPHAHRPGAEPVTAELTRYAARAGLAVTAPEDCPQPWAAGLAGDWQAAALGWDRVGDPYERALELAESGLAEPTLEALRTLRALGAEPAVAVVKNRLRELGVRVVPRGPAPATRTHPAGLTSRQVDVLDLLGEGLTNAEIATRLVVSVRTVDHHVSSILGKLGVPSRRAAVAAGRVSAATGA
jgi:DNA-binding CsgD family transcriptional regulator